MKKIIFRRVYKTLVASLGLAIALPLIAADTGQINYQARLLDSYGRRVNDTVDLSFKIYDAVSDGNLLWSETQSGVVVQDGLYSVVLGSQTALPASVFAQNAIYLELGINGETMSPRQQITASAYSLVARTIMGSNVYENQTSGYVGVGTTNPAVKLDVSGTVQATGFKMPTGATANYVLASDASGVGTWQPYSTVGIESDPIFTNWVQAVYAPSTNNISGSIAAEAATRAAADTALQGNIDASSNALNTTDTALQWNIDTASNTLNTAVGLRMFRSGDIMTGPLSNYYGFFGDGGGLTNISSSGVSLTGVVHKIGDTMTGPLVISNNLIVTYTNEGGYFIATNSITLQGVIISNWNQVAGGDLTNILVNLQSSTNTLNTRVIDLAVATNELYAATNALNMRVIDLVVATNNLIMQITNNLANQANTNAGFEASITNKVNKTGDTMSGVLTLQTNLLVVPNGIIRANLINSYSGAELELNASSTIYFEIGVLGTYNPRAWLQDAGLYIPDNKGIIYGTDGDYMIGYSSGNDSLQFVDGTAVDSNIRMAINSFGNITMATNLTVNGYTGMGEAADTTGSYRLRVTGTMWLTGEMWAFKNGNNRFLFGSAGGAKYGGFQWLDAIGSLVVANNAGSATGFMPTTIVLPESGNVGICITNPSVRLHVAGSVIIETNLTVNGVISNSDSIKWNNAVVIKEGIAGAEVGATAYSNLYYYAAGDTWSNACATNSTSAGGLLGLALGTTPATHGLLLNGQCTGAWNFTAGQIVYMDTNNNQITATMPTGTNHFVRIVGYAINATKIYFNPDRTYIQIMGQ